MKISCTVSEFATMVRNCHDGSCSQCVLNGICKDGEESIEKFVSVADIVTLNALRALNLDYLEDEES